MNHYYSLLLIPTYQTGADPGIFVRGGPTFRKLRQAKKKKKKEKKKEEGRKPKKKTEGCGGSSPSADVIDFPDNYLYIQAFFRWGMVFCTIASPSLHKHKDDIVVLYCNCVGGGRGSSPRRFLSSMVQNRVILDKKNTKMPFV